MSTSSPRTPRLAPEVRRRQLLDAALDVLAEGGFDAVTVEAVAHRAGVTRPVVYDLFGDLQGLMLALIDREEMTALAPLLAIVGGEPGDVDPERFLVDAILAFLRAVKANPRTWRFVLMPPRGSSGELRERIQRSRRLVAERVSALLDWGIARRGGPPGLDHPLAARLIVAAGEDAARLMLAHPRRFPPERLSGLTRDLLSLLPTDARPRGTPPPTLQGPAATDAPPVQSPPTMSRMPRAQRREQLLDVTLALLAQEGFDALSVESVARRAGVNRVVVYRSFANVQVLLVSLLRREDARTRRVLDELLPTSPEGRTPAQLLGDALAGFLSAVVDQPQTWRVALLRPESAPLALQKLVNRRRSQLARRLEPLVRWGLSGLGEAPAAPDIEILARMLLSIGEEQGRLALEDPDFPPERLLASSWTLLDALPLGG
ncbi:MAG: TetR/AcrR family transcriptional regulator [Solirubrobacteraceae bacterium]